MAISEASLSYCVNELRKGRKLSEVAADVKEKFEGQEQEIAIQWLRDQRALTTAHRGKQKCLAMTIEITQTM